MIATDIFVISQDISGVFDGLIHIDGTGFNKTTLQ